MSAKTPVRAASDFDLFADEILVEPYDAFAELRETAGVVYIPANDVYAVTRYDLIVQVLSDTDTFSSTAIGFNPMVNEALQGTSLATDPPNHGPLRAALNKGLTPRALRKIQEQTTEKADALVAALLGQGSFEAIDALARAFPLQVVADLIGFTGEVRDNMLRWGVAAMQVLGPMNQRTQEAFPVAGELYAWCSQVTADDLAQGSVGRSIFEAEERGDSPNSSGHIIHQYLGAGVDSTIASLGNLLALMARHPDQLERIRSDPTLVPAAFEESLRFWPPINTWGRRVMRDVEMDGVEIPAGAQAAVLLGSGNRDPRKYSNPDSFLVERNPVDHLGFGYGTHSCAGQGLARMEAHAILSALARRNERLVFGELQRQPHNVVRGVDKLPIIDVVNA